MNLDTPLLAAHTGGDFMAAVAALLDRHPQGLSEHAMLGLLRKAGYLEFPARPADELHALFCAHFLLFHALYRLRDQARQERRADMEIGPLEIRWLPYQSGPDALGRPDTLREYYLDLAHLGGTTAKDVDALITSFWVRLQRRDGRADALAELGLTDPVDDETIKRTYRRLAMELHPDRGGDEERLQAVNAAVHRLLKSG